MVSKEVLAAHHAEYQSQPDEWVTNMEVTKRSIVKHVLNAVNFQPDSEPVKVVVLGASDKRYIAIHQRIFQDAVQRTLEMKTFDIETDHLDGESEIVVAHDVTHPFPNTPYAIVFSHELMKFLTPQEQLATIRNSYRALAENGIAMHILHEPSIKGTPELRQWQHRVDPEKILRQLEAEDISAVKIGFHSESDVPWLRDTTVILLQK